MSNHDLRRSMRKFHENRDALVFVAVVLAGIAGLLW